MSFQRIAIVGHGLIGGSIALALRARSPEVGVVTIDRNDRLESAADADLIVLSAPVRANLDNLRAFRDHVRPAALITDTGSTKSAILAAAADLRFIGGHPVAGRAASGKDAAQPDLFVGQRWILTPDETTSTDDLAALQGFVGALGAIPTLMSGTDHDRLFAYVSHLPQMTISALMHVIAQSVGRDGLAFAGPGLRDSSRLASSPPDIWRDIAAENRDNITTAIDALIAALQTLRNDVSGGALTEIFESARRSRAALESVDSK